MEQKMKVRDVYKHIKTGQETYIVVVAFDGKEFTGETAVEDCATYEKRLVDDVSFTKIKSLSFPAADFLNTTGTWYYLKDDEEVRIFLYHFSKTIKHVDGKSIVPGEWVTVEYKYDDDYGDRVYFYGWQEMVDQFNELKAFLDRAL